MPTEQKEMAKRPRKGTPALGNYTKGNWELVSFLAFSRQLAERADESAKKASATLLKVGIETDPKKVKNLKRVAEKGAGAINTLSKFRPLLREIVLCRGADNFLAYISNLLFMIHEEQRELLISDEKISYRAVIEAPSKDDLVAQLIERRVNELGYRSIRDLNNELLSRFNFKMVIRVQDLNRVERIIETRNLFVHNSGIVNRRYASKVRSQRTRIGKKVNLSETVLDDILFLQAVAAAVDKRAVSKFKLSVTDVDSLTSTDYRKLPSRLSKLDQD